MLAVSVRIVNQYERGVLLRLERYIGIRGPGLNFIVPFIDKMIKVDLRVVTQNIPAQEVITKDIDQGRRCHILSGGGSCLRRDERRGLRRSSVQLGANHTEICARRS
ncbi:SPFH domain-containing protein [Methanopyrus sp. KOL6]|uniref:SPFH domain-containing protein n=1 Tax=Methanopyrus sp. KOL6 TaxID=1937004 RepID=UPI000B4AD8D6